MHNTSDKKIEVTAVVVPQVTCDLPFHPIPFKSEWSHLSNLQLVDPGFGSPGKIDLLLGVDVFVNVLRHGRRTGPPDSPAHFGWILAGSTHSCSPSDQVATHHASCVSGDELLRKFWEIEETPLSALPKRENVKRLGESRSQALLSLERNLRSKGQFDNSNEVIQEYFDLSHAEIVPAKDLTNARSA